VAGVLEHFCRYEANSAEEEEEEEEEEACFGYATEHGLAKLVHREEWGPRAQAVLYALGELKECGSRAGSRCESGDWPHVLHGESLLVQRYCDYGSKSPSQVVGCIHNVSPAIVLGYARRPYATPAARYAVGERTACGSDSGPFCVERL
jgi:hypothetical protein